MTTAFHFIRPLWLLAALPLLLLAFQMFRQEPVMQAWKSVCDSHLLPYLIKVNGRSKRMLPLMLLVVSALLMIISLAGPTWSRLPVPVYQEIQPRVLVLDLSDAMKGRDLSPDRLSRAKFKVHDLLLHRDAGQFGLVVYTDEPFVVSPLTDDGQTIDELLSSLAPEIMPVDGSRLDRALEQAKQLIIQSGSTSGQILVFTAQVPSKLAIDKARALAHEGIYTSVMPVLGDKLLNPQFARLASEGQGLLVPFTDTSKNLDRWLTSTHGARQYEASLQNDIPVWRDQGRFFLIPVLLLLLAGFRRGWLQRINT